MDSPATQTTSTTSIKNASLSKYKTMYSEYISKMVDLHNDHYKFADYPARDRGFRLRANLKNMSILLKQMQKEALSAYKEQMSLERFERYLAKVEKQRLYENNKRKKKNGHNNWTTKKSDCRLGKRR